MDPRSLPPLRWVRATVLAVVVLVVGSVAHASSDGLLPGGTGMLVLLGLLTLGAALFLGQPSTTPRLVALVIGGQAFVHSALAGMAGHRADAVVQSAGPAPAAIIPWNPRSGLSYEEWALQFTGGHEAALALPAWLTHAVTDVVAHPTMALLHVLAAALVGAWLAVGERALWALVALTLSGAVSLVRWLVATLGAQAAAPLAQSRFVTAAIEALAPVPHRGVWSAGAVRRGPPALVTAL